MEHLFKMIILLPCFYFFSWIDKDNRESKFFPIFYYFYWIMKLERNIHLV
ncbi:Uncharacterised protein [Streptococcus pneumoniae]|nr:Uncharacterised protein [Streptococcus pneumoniae]